MAARRILSFHAHPDDSEILAGGTLALLAEAGHAVTIATMTAGDCGSREHPPELISAVRRKEAEAASAIIGAQYRCAEFHDFAVFDDDPSRRRVTEILRGARPDIVIAASPVDYLCDHENASALVRDCCFAAPIPNYRTGGHAAVLPAIPHLYFMQPLANVDRDGRAVTPDFVVDISAVFDKKRAVLACHESQRNWLREHHGMDEYLDMMERWSRDCGQAAGFAFGEGFRRYKGHPYPQTSLLEELLADRVRFRGGDL